MPPTLRHVLMMPAPGEGGEGGGGTPPANPPAGGEAAADKVKVTLPGGLVLELAKADAEKVITAQQAANAERTELARRAGAAEAERRAAQEAAEAKARETEAVKLAKDGEVAKARELFSAEANRKLDALTGALRVEALGNAIRKAAPHLDATDLEDISQLIGSRAAFDADNRRLVILGTDGKPLTGQDGNPVGAESYLADFLKARPRYQAATVPPATGGKPGAPPPVAGTIRQSEVRNATPAQAEAMQKGTLRVVPD